jgi:putative SOS response-associated peptidase YedK
MCGRFVLDRKTTDLVTLFDVDVVGERLPEPSWNIAPTSLIAVVIDSLPRAASSDDYPEPIRRLHAARWGLVHSSAASPSASPPLFNARSEDAAAKPTFQDAVAHRRAVVPATGYYEWRDRDGAKQPYFVSLPGDELMLFAAVYEWWRNPAAAADDPEKWLLSTSILTRAATGTLADLHPRSPVFLDADLVEQWLDPAEEGTQELVDYVSQSSEFVSSRVQFHAVDPAVGSVKNNGPHLVEATGTATAIATE